MSLSSGPSVAIRQRCEKFDVIMGDLNLNPSNETEKKKIMKLCNSTKYMALEEVTTVNNNQLDHILISLSLKSFCFATSYFNFGSDHKPICLRMSASENEFRESFLQNINFDSDLHLRKRQNKPGHFENSTNQSEPNLTDEIIENTIGPTNQANPGMPNELKILSLINPSGSNLCFSNVVTSVLLNVPILVKALFEEPNLPNVNCNKIICEIRNLSNLKKYETGSSKKLRNIVTSLCFNLEQHEKNYSNNKQHDAGEFLQSVIEHIFKGEGLPQFFDEQMFGGLYQDKVICKCGIICESPIQKLSEILPLEIVKPNIQDCLDHIFKSEKVRRTCLNCGCQTGTKSTKFISDPSTLILLLKRYEFHEETKEYAKKHDPVVCPQELTLPSGSVFSISAVINHMGETPKEGHYNVMLYDIVNELYFSLDDMNITTHSSIPKNTNRTHYIAVYLKTE